MQIYQIYLIWTQWCPVIEVILEVVYELQKLTIVEPIIPGTQCYLLSYI